MSDCVWNSGCLVLVAIKKMFTKRKNVWISYTNLCRLEEEVSNFACRSQMIKGSLMYTLLAAGCGMRYCGANCKWNFVSAKLQLKRTQNGTASWYWRALKRNTSEALVNKIEPQLKFEIFKPQLWPELQYCRPQKIFGTTPTFAYLISIASRINCTTYYKQRYYFITTFIPTYWMSAYILHFSFSLYFWNISFIFPCTFQTFSVDWQIRKYKKFTIIIITIIFTKAQLNHSWQKILAASLPVTQPQHFFWFNFTNAHTHTHTRAHTIKHTHTQTQNAPKHIFSHFPPSPPLHYLTRNFYFYSQAAKISFGGFPAPCALFKFRAGHFRYFWIFSIIKNYFLHFLSS